MFKVSPKIIFRILVVIVCVLSAILISLVDLRTKINSLTIELMSDQERSFRLYYDTGSGYNEQESVDGEVLRRDMRATAYHFPIPHDKTLIAIRIDPDEQPSRYLIKTVSVNYLYNSKRIYPHLTWNAEQIEKLFVPLHNVKPFVLQQGYLLVETEGPDPHFGTKENLSGTWKRLRNEQHPLLLPLKIGGYLLLALMAILFFFHRYVLTRLKEVSHFSSIPRYLLELLDRWKNPDFLFYVILVLAILFHILHGLILPIMISWDGYLYVQLADILGTSQFPSKWDFLRTPLFPLSLKMAFIVGGKNPLSVIMLNIFFGLTGILLIVSVVKQSWGPFSATIALLLLSFYPTLIVYEHCLLSEMSTFFCLAIIIKLLSDNHPQHHYFLKALFLMLGVTLGYYFRPTLLYLSPLVALLFGLSLWKQKAHPENMKRLMNPHKVVIIITIVLIAVGPFATAYPWKQISKDESSRMAQQIIFGFVKQAAIPINSPLLGAATDKYSQSIKQSLNNGHLMLDGIRSDTLFYEVADSIYKEYDFRLGDFLGPAIYKAPQSYLKRIIATLLYFTGFPGIESDTQMFTGMVLSDDTGSKLLSGPESIRKQIERDFSRPSGKNFSLPLMLRWLNPFFSVLIIAGWLATVFIFIVGLLQRDRRLLAFSTIPLAFLLMHALTLMAVDRLIMPVYPLVLVNLVLVLASLFRPLKRTFRP